MHEIQARAPNELLCNPPSYWSKRCNANSWLLVSSRKKNLFLHFARLCVIFFLFLLFISLHYSYLLTSPSLNVKHICFVMLLLDASRNVFELHGGTFFHRFFFIFYSYDTFCPMLDDPSSTLY